MSEELNIAFEQMAERGQAAGATVVVTRALGQVRPAEASGLRRHSFAAVAALVASVAVVVAGIAVVRSRVPDIDRVDVGAALSDGDGAAGTMTVLAVGSDSRSGLDDPMRRADAIMLLRIDQTSGAVSVLSMQRDLYVPIAGTGSSDRLSVAAISGPTALIETVRAVTGIAIDHYLEFDFTGFKKVVDAAGGLDLQVPEPMRDELAGLDLPAGCTHLDGAAALAYVQARHVLIQDADGRFHADPTGDLGRISRQQHLFLVALDQLTRTRDLARIDRVADAIADNVRVDDDFSLREVVAFAKHWVRTSRPLNLLVYPSTAAALSNGAAVLNPDTAQAPAVINLFNNPPSGEETTERESPPSVSCG